MKTFLAIYVGGSSPKMATWMAMGEAERKAAEAEGIAAWGDWMKTHDAAVVAPGGPLGKTKRTDAQGVSDTKNALGGYVVVQAASHEDAARMFENHPHFTIFPGDAVEIMECLPVPTRS